MRKLTVLAAAFAVMTTASLASAAKVRTKRVMPKLLAYDKTKFVSVKHAAHYQPPPPAPGSGSQLTPVPAGPQGDVVPHGAMPLYHNVKVEDPDHIHPCAVPKVVRIVDPCWKPDRCGCCAPAAPRCVYVKICVPPCACERVKVSKNGRKVKYDYGDYSVELKSKDGCIEVDYDD